MFTPLTTREFRLFQALVHREAGIYLSDQKRALLVGRLAPRMRALATPTFAAYFDRVSSDPAALAQMIDAICTNETSFFRESKQFAFLENELLPAWRLAAERGERRKVIRAWSAGCSTGEEPYSIAMTLAASLPDWTIDVLASDLSRKALDRAAEGIWPIERAEQIPPRYRKAYMLRGSGPQEGRMTARREIASLIKFQSINLHHDPLPAVGRFDLIFCRNVLIYFDAPSKQRVINRLLDRLEPAGCFFLGHSESLSYSERVRSVGPTIYALKDHP